MSDENGSNKKPTVARPVLKAYMTGMVSAPVKGPSDQPCVLLSIDSGDLRVEMIFPAEHAEPICEDILRSAHVSEAADSSGIILAGESGIEEAKRAAAREHEANRKLKGEE